MVNFSKVCLGPLAGCHVGDCSRSKMSSSYVDGWPGVKNDEGNEISRSGVWHICSVKVYLLHISCCLLPKRIGVMRDLHITISGEICHD